MKIVIKDTFLKKIKSIQKRYLIVTKIYFYPKEIRLKKLKNLFAT